MKFKEVVLVIFLILAGLVLYEVKTGHWSFDWAWDWDEGGFGPAGREVTAEETRTIAAPLPAVLEVENGHGWVEVRGADQDFAQLTFKKVVWRRNEAEAREIAGRIRYTMDTAAGKLRLATNREEFRRKNFETGFVLTVPRSMTVRVTNGYGTVRIEDVGEAAVTSRHGEVFVSGIDGPCALETSYEDVEARDIKGTCRIVNRNGDVRAVSITGDLTVRTSYARIRVEDAGGRADLYGPNSAVEALRVAGPVRVEASYEKVHVADVGPAGIFGHNMTVSAENVRGDLEVRTSYEAVKAAGIRGKLMVEAHNAAVEARDIEGPLVSIQTSYDNVTLAGFSGEASIVNRNGNVSLEPKLLKGPISVDNEHGSIVFLWPAGERARFEARARGGSIRWGLSAKPDVDETNGSAVLKAFSAEAAAPLVTLSTAYDDIRVEEAGRKF
ncbi:MAG TPA: hypothetical protein P5119_10165 [Candidatus Aminicenantes bacterium]|nr:hypothetical protein [Candidatus Aminicenantes bacterium]HRY65687.1 hypothetical protein [Candidatus Aminicenantes bacterium]HRZ72425.1 hypothetical protein [Candidatus Aminicenantes bacterium]